MLPLAGALINGLFGGRLRSERAVAVVACVAVLAAFVLSLGAVVQLAAGLEGYAEHAPPNVRVNLEGRQVEMTLASWIPGGGEGSLVVDWAFTLDPLSGHLFLFRNRRSDKATADTVMPTKWVRQLGRQKQLEKSLPTCMVRFCIV